MQQIVFIRSQVSTIVVIFYFCNRVNENTFLNMHLPTLKNETNVLNTNIVRSYFFSI